MSFVLVCFAEVVLRSFGVCPSQTNDVQLWSYWRARVYDGKPLVILGSSRVATAMDPKLLSSGLDEHKVVNLSIIGTPPWATLRDLCLDPEFHGQILCEADVWWLSKVKSMERGRVGFVKSFAKRPHRSLAFGEDLEITLRSYLYPHFAVLSGGFSLKRLIQGKFFDPVQVITRFDRHLTYHLRDPNYDERFLRLVKNLVTARGKQDLPSPIEFSKILHKHIIPWIRALTARGGQVFFVRLPTNSAIELLDSRGKAAALWTTFSKEIHVPLLKANEGEFTAFRTYDGLHLRAEDVKEFNHAVLRWLRPQYINFLPSH